MSAECLGELRSIIDRLLDRPGRVFYSNSRTLSPGHVSIYGLNPGGDPTALETIGQNIERFGRNPDLSAMDEEWFLRHQNWIDVRQLFNELGFDMREAFWSNVYFIRTRDSRQLWALTDFQEVRDICRRANEYILGVRRPKIIFCLGNGNGKGSSAFSIMRRWAVLPTEEPTFFNGAFRGGKFCKARFSYGEVVLIGLPHPGRFGLPDHIRSIIVERLRREFPDYLG